MTETKDKKERYVFFEKIKKKGKRRVSAKEEKTKRKRMVCN